MKEKDESTPKNELAKQGADLDKDRRAEWQASEIEKGALSCVK